MNTKQLRDAVLGLPAFVSADDDTDTDQGVVDAAAMVLDRIRDDGRPKTGADQELVNDLLTHLYQEADSWDRQR